MGLERAGMQIVWQVENDPFRQQVLAKHWPGVRRYGDIRQLDPTELEPVDLVAGGPPCQPVSLAGKRRGKADDRWLWGETIRIVAGLRPRWCLFENPIGFISMGLDDVLSALETLGYSCRAAVIPACIVGAPHRRDRVWIVAYSKRQGLQRSAITKMATASKSAKGGEIMVCNCGVAQSGVGGDFARFPSRMDGYRWPAPFGCDQYDWEPPRLAQGKIPHRRERLMALGDAVVPQVAEAIGRAIMAVR